MERATGIDYTFFSLMERSAEYEEEHGRPFRNFIELYYKQGM